MNVLVVGAGGREHAILWAFQQNPEVKKIYCSDGNAGIGGIAECVSIKPTQIPELVEFALENEIDLTFVGGETALSLGIVDEFKRNGLRIIGASKSAARLEASKSFAKDFMARHLIPTAKYQIAGSVQEAKGLLSEFETGVVVKADGLAGGKGVIVCQDHVEASLALDELESIVGSDAMSQIVLEELLIGKEVSLLMFADGENFALMPAVRDHKRIGEGDIGANTGGMGTFSDDSLLSLAEIEYITERIVIPTLRGCLAEGFSFSGILFIGLMLTESGANVLEYNVRFGDPETQSILVRLNTDLLSICQAMTQGNLNKIDIKWKSGSSACVVLAAENYPASPKLGDVISGLDSKSDAVVFHAGTAKDEQGNFVTAGGRVLGVTATGKNVNEALGKVYRAVDQISWNGMQYRRDIGKSR